MQNKAKQSKTKTYEQIIGLFYFVDKSIIWRKSGKYKNQEKRKRENQKKIIW